MDKDASIVTTHMMLCAKSVGVDSCWVNFFDPDKMADAFQLPENEEILTCLALGYAAEGAGPLANHNSRKPIKETRCCLTQRPLGTIRNGRWTKSQGV